MKGKTTKQLERHFKGVANHYRIAILGLVARKKELTLEEIVELLDANVKTISEHTRKLVHAGLLNKRYRGRMVIHTLSPYGEISYKFIVTF